jgi:hypothetical protein
MPALLAGALSWSDLPDPHRASTTSLQTLLPGLGLPHKW